MHTRNNFLDGIWQESRWFQYFLLLGMSGKVSDKSHHDKKSDLSTGIFAHMSAKIPPPPSKDDNDEDENSKDNECDWDS